MNNSDSGILEHGLSVDRTLDAMVNNISNLRHRAVAYILELLDCSTSGYTKINLSLCKLIHLSIQVNDPSPSIEYQATQCKCSNESIDRFLVLIMMHHIFT